jgi:hypothetical protein
VLADFEYRIVLLVLKLPTLRVKSDIIYELKEVTVLVQPPSGSTAMEAYHCVLNTQPLVPN